MSSIRLVCHSVRYIRLFWRKFYQLPQENEESDPLVWQKAAKQLTWHNQLELAGFYQKHCDGIEHKASAWFYVTYKDELNNHQPTTNQNDRLYSFPWLVYPILLHIYDRHCEDDETDLTILVTKRRKKNRRRRSERRKRQRT